MFPVISERVAQAVEHAGTQTMAQQNLTEAERGIAHAMLQRLSNVVPNDPGILTLRIAVGTPSYRRCFIAALTTIAAITHAVAKVEEREQAEATKLAEDAERNATATDALVYDAEPKGEKTIRNLDGNGLPLTGSVAAVA